MLFVDQFLPDRSCSDVPGERRIRKAWKESCLVRSFCRISCGFNHGVHSWSQCHNEQKSLLFWGHERDSSKSLYYYHWRWWWKRLEFNRCREKKRNWKMRIELNQIELNPLISSDDNLFVERTPSDEQGYWNEAKRGRENRYLQLLVMSKDGVDPLSVHSTKHWWPEIR